MRITSGNSDPKPEQLRVIQRALHQLTDPQGISGPELGLLSDSALIREVAALLGMGDAPVWRSLAASRLVVAATSVLANDTCAKAQVAGQLLQAHYLRGATLIDLARRAKRSSRTIDRGILAAQKSLASFVFSLVEEAKRGARGDDLLPPALRAALAPTSNCTCRRNGVQSVPERSDAFDD